MSLEILLYVAAVCALSAFAHGAIGFGFPVVATPLVALVIDMKSAIILLAPVTLVLVVISALRGGGVGELARNFWFLPVGIAAGAWLGTRILLATPPEPFTLVLALMLLFYLNLDRLGRGHSDTVVRLRVLFGIAFAFVTGDVRDCLEHPGNEGKRTSPVRSCWCISCCSAPRPSRSCRR